MGAVQRLAVEFIIDLLAQGWSEEDILRNYPGLAHEDIIACLGYASALLRAERVFPPYLSPTLGLESNHAHRPLNPQGLLGRLPSRPGRQRTRTRLVPARFEG